jgi:hypothetical protein
MVWIAAALALAAQEKAPVRVYLLAGQSNMQGHGHLRTLDWLGEDATYGRLRKLLKAPDGGWARRSDAFIHYERSEKELKKGPLGVGFGVSDNHVGPELMFGTILAERHEEPILLVKAAWGGRSLALNFRPPSAGEPPLASYPEEKRKKLEESIAKGSLVVGREYREMIRRTKDVVAKLDELFPELAGRGARLAGVVWVQGWNDMIDDAFTAEYASNLAHFVKDLRRDLDAPALPVAVAEMGIDGDAAGPKIAAFRRAQAEGVKKAGEGVRFVETARHWDPVAAAVLKEGWKGRKWITKELEEKWNRMGSQEAYHYMGSAKVYSLMGYALAQAFRDGFTPTEEYRDRAIAGWSVKAHLDVPDAALRLLETRLEDVVRLLPAKAVERLRQVPIWIGGFDGEKGIAQYHPSRDWLEKNGYNPEKARAVDLGCPAMFVRETTRQPFMVLHELAHAYHDRVLSFDHEKLKASHQAAVKSGRYDSVLFWDGRKVKHYGLTTPQEHFAEATEAYFGTNDFYPFVRPELREHDPELAKLIEELWGLR